jgi:hypothetical protein
MARPSDANRWMSEDAAFAAVGLSRRTGRELVAQGVLQPSQDGIFRRRDIIEAAIAKRARDVAGHSGADWGNAWNTQREDGAIDTLLQRAASEEARERLEIVVDEATLGLTAVLDDGHLVAAVRGSATGRRFVVIDMTDELNTALDAFGNRANRGAVPARRRGRPRKTAHVYHLSAGTNGDP